jgi:hypothetical protein
VLTHNPLSVRHQSAFNGTPRISKQPTQEEIVENVEYPKSLSRKPLQEPNNPAPLNISLNRLHSTAMPAIKILSDIQDNLGIGIRCNELYSEARTDGIGHSYTMAYQFIELSCGNANVAI